MNCMCVTKQANYQTWFDQNYRELQFYSTFSCFHLSGEKARGGMMLTLKLPIYIQYMAEKSN